MVIMTVRDDETRNAEMDQGRGNEGKCSNCGGTGSSSNHSLKTCGDCCQELYCSEACQRLHWFRHHRMACKQYQLLLAIQHQDAVAVQRLSHLRRVVNARLYQHSNTAAHVCAERGGEALLQALLAGGVTNVNLRNDFGETPLFLACQGGDAALETVQLLLAAGAHPNAVSSDGYSALMLAVRERGFKVLQALLQAGADVNVGRNLAGRSPLGVAELYASGRLQFAAPGEDWECVLQQHRDILAYLRQHVAATTSHED